MIVCPLCKTEYDQEPETCSNCNYPFSADKETQSKFIGQQIMKKSRIKHTRSPILLGRYVLFIVGLFQLLIPLTYGERPDQEILTILEMFLALFFFVLAVLSRKFPLVVSLLSFIMFSAYYIVQILADPEIFLRGAIWKMLFFIILLINVFSVAKARRLQKQSAFLKSQKVEE